MNKEGKKCAIYVRVSTEMQVDGFSLDGQRNILKKYAEREGMIIRGVYEDAGKSGKSISGRPAFQKLLNDINEGLDIDYILVYKLSRFGRNAADILTSIEYIQSYDINLIATEEGIDSSQTSGKLLISVLSAVSEIERENILEQTMNGRREKARQGGWNGGFAPYGYIFKDGTFYIDEEEAANVREIYNLYVNENYSFGKIAKRFNMLGITKKLMKNRKLTAWGKDSIKKILENPIYKGTIAFGRRTKTKVKGTRDKYIRIETDDYITGEGKHEAIIDVETWEQAQLIMKEKGKQSKNPNYDRKYLLSGLLRCPCCGNRMSSQINMWTTLDGNSYSRRYYHCRHASGDTGHSCTNKGRLLMEDADKFIVDIVKRYINNGVFAEKIKEQLAIEIDTSHIEKQKADFTKTLNQVLANKESLENTIDYLPLEAPHRERRLADLNKRLADLYDVIDEIENNIKDIDLKLKGINKSTKSIEGIMEILNNFEQLFDQMTDEERRNLITLIIKEIHFNENNQIGKIIFKFNVPQEETNVINIQNKVVDDSVVIEMNIEGESIGLIPFREVPNRQVKPKVIKEKVVKEKIPKLIENKPRAQHYNRKTATYKQIQEYIKQEFGLIAHSSYIAEIKRKYGVEMQSNRQKEVTKQSVKHPTKEMTKAIEAALIHFNIINENQITE